MSEAIQYCDNCGKLIPPGAADREGALVTPSAAFCPACAAALSAEDRARLDAPADVAGGAVPVSRPAGGSRRESRALAPRAAGPGRPSLAAPLMALAGSALVGFLVAVVIMLGRNEKEGGAAPSPGPGPEPSAVTRPPPPADMRPDAPATTARAWANDVLPGEAGAADASPPAPVPAEDEDAPHAPEPAPAARDVSVAAEGPATEREAATPPAEAPAPGSGADAGGKAPRPAAEAPGEGPRTDEAKAPAAGSQEEVAEEAERAVASCLESAEGLVALGRFDEAAASFARLRDRFAGNEWSRAGGEARIVGALGRVEMARAAYAASALAVRDDFSKHADGSDASPRWSSQGGKVQGGALVFESGGRATVNAREGKLVTVAATVVPQRRTGGDWTFCGVSAWQHAWQYWDIALAEGPDGVHYLIMFELFRGTGTQSIWHRLPARCDWSYGNSYRVTIELSLDGVQGYVDDPGGRRLGNIGKAFDDARRASISCRPGVVATGCAAAFDDFSASSRSGQRASDASEDGYLLGPVAFFALPRRYDGEKGAPRKLAAVGGAVAASPLFERSLQKELARGKGYVFAGKTGLARKGLTVAEALKGLGRALDREKPEVVRVCFDATDLAKGRPAVMLRPDVERIVDEILGRGAVPVLYTLPMKAPPQEEALKLVEDFNRMILDVAADRNIPCVDAFGVLNDPDAASESFSRSGALAVGGFQALNDAFLKLYRVLERWVMGREAEEAG